MLDPGAIPSVVEHELLARFVYSSGHRRADGTVKGDAFIPPANLEVSVSRHREATDDELWGEGQRIATERTRTLYGRADFKASAAIAEDLGIAADPQPGNPNHANIFGWPTDKPIQKMKALQLASASVYTEAP